MRPFSVIVSILLSSFELGSSLDFGFLDLYEMDHIKYAVVIDGKPVRIDRSAVSGEREETESTAALAPRIWPMTNKFGQKYHCLLPDITADHDDRDHGRASMSLPTFVSEMKTLMTTMSGKAPCLLKTKDWWSYELCPGKIIKQYHIEDGKPQGKIVVLGHFDHDYEWSEEDRQKGQLMHHSQFYNNGSQCDLTGNLRKTEVKYHCEPSAVFDSIIEVHEPLSCEYVISVATSKLCSIPELKPLPKSQAKEIKCQPALNKMDYEKYEILETEREKQLDEKNLQTMEKQRTKMLNFIGDDIPRDLDIHSEEGLRFLEEMVEQKMADSVMLKLNSIIGEVFATGPNAAQSAAQDKKTEFLGIVDHIVNMKRFKMLMPMATKKLGPKDLKVSEGPTQKADDKFDVEAERRVRSDAISEKDLVDDLQSTFSKLKATKQDELLALKVSKEFQENIQESLKEIVEETEQEFGAKLDPTQEGQLDKFAETIKDLIKKVDFAESEIKRVNAEIEKVQDIIDRELDYDDYGEEGGRRHYKHDNTLSVKRELREEDYYEDDLYETEHDDHHHEDIESTTTNADGTDPDDSATVPNPRPLENSPSEARIARRVESLVRSKLVNAGGIDLGGRQVQIKVVTFNVEDPELAESLAENSGEGEEAQRLQDMIYNLMIGNQQAYDDIDIQRKSERNYKFQLPENVPPQPEHTGNKDRQENSDDKVESNQNSIEKE